MSWLDPSSGAWARPAGNAGTVFDCTDRVGGREEVDAVGREAGDVAVAPEEDLVALDVVVPEPAQVALHQGQDARAGGGRTRQRMHLLASLQDTEEGAADAGHDDRGDGHGEQQLDQGGAVVVSVGVLHRFVSVPVGFSVSRPRALAMLLASSGVSPSMARVATLALSLKLASPRSRLVIRTSGK